MKKYFPLFLLLMFLLPIQASAELDIHFLDVGHGDSTIIICNGAAMLIDGGDSGESDKIFTAIRDLGIKKLQCVIATHPQSDHIGGLPAAFHAAEVGTLYTPVTAYDSERFRTLMDKATEMSVPIVVPEPGDYFTLGSCVVTFIAPITKYKDPNDMSIIVRVDYHDQRFLFCGDAGEAVEKALLKSGADLDADVIKIAHHGSDSATTPAFIAAVSPRYAVISCSARYDNPDADVLETILSARCDLLRTDANGDIVLRSDGKSITIETEAHLVGNINSEIYHRHTCNSVSRMSEKNKDIIYTKDQAEREGYRPCKNCSP